MQLQKHCRNPDTAAIYMHMYIYLHMCFAVESRQNVMSLTDDHLCTAEREQQGAAESCLLLVADTLTPAGHTVDCGAADPTCSAPSSLQAAQHSCLKTSQQIVRAPPSFQHHDGSGWTCSECPLTSKQQETLAGAPPGSWKCWKCCSFKNSPALFDLLLLGKKGKPQQSRI